ncbi:hypothetical protein QYE76_035365 [Lolium multiflorum]|uniref:Uncharacterized protein n=1 Tax=Lolium multiflorum TaxID=4521 RepID=A0AAD8QZW1_LOLMU|nr:hypothetical protein QYE76_035365 [Lolium multiflorum]
MQLPLEAQLSQVLEATHCSGQQRRPSKRGGGQGSVQESAHGTAWPGASPMAPATTQLRRRLTAHSSLWNHCATREALGAPRVQAAPTRHRGRATRAVTTPTPIAVVALAIIPTPRRAYARRG